MYSLLYDNDFPFQTYVMRCFHQNPIQCLFECWCDISLCTVMFYIFLNSWWWGKQSFCIVMKNHFLMLFCTAKYNQLIFLFSWYFGDDALWCNIFYWTGVGDAVTFLHLCLGSAILFKLRSGHSREKNSTCELPKAYSGIVRFPNPLLQEVNWGARQGLGKSLLRRRKWPVPGRRATIGGKCVIGSRSLLRSAEVTRSVPGWWNRSMGGAPFCSGSFDTLDGGCRGRIRSNILHPGVKHPTCDKSRDVWGRFSHYIYLLPVGSRLTLNRTNRRLFWAAT